MSWRSVALVVAIAFFLVISFTLLKEESSDLRLTEPIIEAPGYVLEGERVKIEVKFENSELVRNVFLILDNGTKLAGNRINNRYIFTISATEDIANSTIVVVDRGGRRFEKRVIIKVEKTREFIEKYSEKYGIKESMLWKLYREEPRLVYLSIKKNSPRLKIALDYAEDYEDFSTAVKILDPNVLKVAVIVENGGKISIKELQVPYALAYCPAYSIDETLAKRADLILGCTYSRFPLLKLPPWVIKTEVLLTTETLQEYSKFDNRTLILPQGEYNSTVLQILEEMGVKIAVAPFSKKLKVYEHDSLLLIATPEIGVLEDLALIYIPAYDWKNWRLLESLAHERLFNKSVITLPFKIFVRIAREYAVREEELSYETVEVKLKDKWIIYSQLLREADSLLEYIYHERGGNQGLIEYGEAICSILKIEPFLSSGTSKEVEEAIIELGLALNKVKRKAKIARSWIFWLQNIDYEILLGLPVDLAVIDPDEANFTKNQILELRETGKLIIAYLSIGEAEDYRSYWKEEWYVNPPEWLGEENPEWRGCYKVKYWMEGWREIVFNRLDEIVKLGYDGVYLDVVDAYEYWMEKGYSEARDEIVKLVIEISRKAKKVDPDFLIIPQNAVELVAIPEYLKAIDGIGKEDTWFLLDEPRPAELVERDLRYLEVVARSGKIVLVIDYVTDPDNVESFFSEALKHGYAAYVGPLELDSVGFISDKGKTG